MKRPLFKVITVFICGAGASLALPPTGWLLAALGLSIPVILAMRASRPAFGALLFGMGGFGWFTASLYWIANALFVKGGVQLLLLPFAVLGLPLLLSLFWMAAAYLALRLSAHIPTRLVFLACFWGLAEWLRSFVLTGFPWNVTGHIFAENLLLAQMAAYTGQDGLNILAGLFITSAAALYLRAFSASMWMGVPVFLMLGLSLIRFSNLPPIDAQDSIIRLIQPNIAQIEKWDRARKSEHISRMIKLASQPASPAALTILPEAAIAGFWRDERDGVQALAQTITPRNGVLLTGILSTDLEKNFFNSAFFLHHSGGLLGQYHKQHLVPFGEYIPFRKIPFVSALAGQGEFTPGPPAEDIFIEPFGYIRVLICYEIIFPSFIAKDSRRPDIIITLSNDAWFGQSIGPHQHFAQSRLRAIEEGLPVYRLANTGVSGGFDSFGRLLGKSKLGVEAVLDLPHIHPAPAPFYVKNRSLLFWLIILWLVGGAIFLEFANQKSNKWQDDL